MLARILRFLLAIALLTSLAVAAWLHIARDWSPIQALTAGLLVPPLAHATLLGIEFIVTGWLGAGAKLPAGVEQINRGGRLKAWLTEVPTAVQVFGLRMPLRGHLPLATSPAPTRIPVVLIHGYFCNRAMFGPLATHLAARGHPVESVNLEPVFGSIDQYPSLIDAAVNRAIGHFSDGRVVLIGHSMGGIAARAYLRDFGEKLTARVITLGAPHQGTLLARIGHTEIVRQLDPDSAWLKQLAGDEPAERYGLFTVIISRHDNIVTPQCTQTLAGAQNICFSGLGHVDLACNPAVFAVIDRVLEGQQAPAGGPGFRTTAETT